MKISYNFSDNLHRKAWRSKIGRERRQREIEKLRKGERKCEQYRARMQIADSNSSVSEFC
jgi:hypothetical protein